MKKIIKITIVAASLLIGCLLITDQKEDLSYLMFENVEALAEGELPDFSVNCYGHGEVDCYGYKVEVKIVGASLDEFE